MSASLHSCSSTSWCSWLRQLIALSVRSLLTSIIISITKAEFGKSGEVFDQKLATRIPEFAPHYIICWVLMSILVMVLSSIFNSLK